MKILFVMFSTKKRDEHTPYERIWSFPKASPVAEPLMFGVLADRTPKDVALKLYDDRLENIPYDEEADAVAITVETLSARRAYDIAGQFRSRGIPVIMGGCHPTLVPDEAACYADAVVIGDAELVWPEVVNDLRRKKLRRIYRSPGLVSVEGIRVRRDIFKDKIYSRAGFVETARGCTFDCNFCTVTQIYQRTLRCRPIQEVVRDVEYARSNGKRFIIFTDDNVVCNVKRAKELCRALIPLAVHWMGQGSIHVAQDRELLRLLCVSGCQWLFIGLETLSENNLKSMGKQWARCRLSYQEAIRRIHDAGINVEANFIFGYDEDDESSFDETLSFSIDQGLFMANFFPVMPFPGTPWYTVLEKQGRLLYPQWWLQKDFSARGAVFMPQRLSPEKLFDRCLRNQKEFMRWRSLLRRGSAANNLRNLPLFLYFNWPRDRLKGRTSSALQENRV